MIFLIDYQPRRGKLGTIQEFRDDQRTDAEDARLARELALRNESDPHEVVLLQASDLDALKRTHRRYFATLEEIFASTTDAMTLKFTAPAVHEPKPK